MASSANKNLNQLCAEQQCDLTYLQITSAQLYVSYNKCLMKEIKMR